MGGGGQSHRVRAAAFHHAAQNDADYQSPIGATDDMIPPRTILAPVDFSEPSRTALATAGRLAHQTDATLVVVYAEEPLMAEAARHANIDLGADTNSELETFI